MISQSEAREIVKSKLGSLISYELEVSDGRDHTYSLYGTYDWDNLWVISVIERDRTATLEDTFIALVHKESGENVYSGYAADEG